MSLCSRSDQLQIMESNRNLIAWKVVQIMMTVIVIYKDHRKLHGCFLLLLSWRSMNDRIDGSEPGFKLVSIGYMIVSAQR